jgi:anti-sigma B factor antagonist
VQRSRRRVGATVPGHRFDVGGVVRSQVRGTAVDVRVVGELDLTESQELHEQVVAALDAGASEVTIDLSGVTFLDPSGLQGLMWSGDAGRAGQPVRLVRPSPVVERLLRTTGLGGRLTIADG